MCQQLLLLVMPHLQEWQQPALRRLRLLVMHHQQMWQQQQRAMYHLQKQQQPAMTTCLMQMWKRMTKQLLAM
jgi:hypothetical protein